MGVIGFLAGRETRGVASLDWAANTGKIVDWFWLEIGELYEGRIESIELTTSQS